MDITNFNNWEALLKNLQEEKQIDNNKRVFYDSDVNIAGSKENLINTKADFADLFFKELYRDLSDSLKSNNNLNTDDIKDPDKIKSYWPTLFWNESISLLLSKYWFYFNKEDQIYEDENKQLDKTHTTGTIPIKDGMAMQSNGIKDGDAGYNFVKEDEMYDKWKKDEEGNKYRKVSRPWVNPWYNIDGNTYSNVRAEDKHLSVLANEDNLQKTREQGHDKNKSDSSYEWTRLLMPKNKRRVEIEDINRNFWVIGQTIASISAYLFDEEAPINDLFSGILNEIMQLWENIIFLWGSLAVKNKRKYNKTHCEVIYLTNEKNQPYAKYNGFNNINIVSSNLVNEIQSRLSFLKNEYQDFNLAILPCIRVDNYEHNYYSTIYYPFLLTLNRNEGNINWNIIPIKESNKNMIEINLEDYYSYLYGFKEREDTYDYFFPFSENEKVEVEEDEFFYAACREKIDIDILIETDKIIINNLKITYEDAFRKILKNENSDIFTINLNYSMNILEATRTNYTISDTTTEETEFLSISKGIYLGELLSNNKKIEAHEWAYRDINVPLQPFMPLETLNSYNNNSLLNTNGEAMTPMPTKYTFYDSKQNLSFAPPETENPDKWEEWFNSNAGTAIAKEDSLTLKKYFDLKVDVIPRTIYFVTGSHMYATGYAEKDNKAIISTVPNFYKIDNKEVLQDESRFSTDKKYHTVINTNGYSKGLYLYIPKKGIGGVQVPDYKCQSDYWSPSFPEDPKVRNQGLTNWIIQIYYQGNRLTSSNWIIKYTNIAAVSFGPKADPHYKETIPEDIDKYLELYWKNDGIFIPFRPDWAGTYCAGLTGYAISYIHPDGSINEVFLQRQKGDSALGPFNMNNIKYEKNWNSRPNIYDGSWKLFYQDKKGILIEQSLFNDSETYNNKFPDFEKFPENGYAGHKSPV